MSATKAKPRKKKRKVKECKNRNPTPKQIAKMCKEIRSGQRRMFDE